MPLVRPRWSPHPPVTRRRASTDEGRGGSVGEPYDGEPGPGNLDDSRLWASVGDGSAAELGERAVGDLTEPGGAGVDQLLSGLLDVVGVEEDERLVDPGQDVSAISVSGVLKTAKSASPGAVCCPLLEKAGPVPNTEVQAFTPASKSRAGKTTVAMWGWP